MRRYESEYRLTRAAATKQHFLDEVRNFNRLFDLVDGAPSMKQQLNAQVQAYSRAFTRWAEITDRMQPLLNSISRDTERVVPEADRIIEMAQFSAGSGGNRIGGIAHADSTDHVVGGMRGGIDQHRLELAYRPQHHGSARWIGDGHAAACRRRYVGAYSRHAGA